MIHSRLWYIRITIHSLILPPSQCQPVGNSAFILSLCYCRRREALSVCKNFSSQICFILSMTFSHLSLAVSVCILLLQWLLLTLSAHLDFTCHPSVYFFSHLLLVVPIWVCVKYSSFCLLLCHTHTQLHQLFPQLLIHYFVKYQWKRTQHKLKKKNVNPIPHTASFTFTLKSWKYCPKSAKNYECICKHSKLEQYSLLVH